MRKLAPIPLLCLFSLATPAQAAQEPGRIEVAGPKAVLTNVAFDIRFTVPELPGPGAWSVALADGRVLATGDAAPGDEVEVSGIRLERRSDLPLRVSAASQTVEFDPLMFPGWFSILPPLLAIALALIFREVVIALFAGIWLGALFVVGLNPIAATLRTVDTFVAPALAHPDHAAIIIFSLMLGGMVGLMGRSGGTRGIVEALAPLATTRRRGQLATYLAGLAIFFDDYANTLIVGNTLRPITDRLRISREKLSYLVDSTAAPVAAIIFVSTWAGYEIGLIGDGLQAAANQVASADPALAARLEAASPFAVFLSSIPYLFYPILALCMVFLVAWTQRDIGPMLAAERRAAQGDGVYRAGAMLMVDTSAELLDAKQESPRRWYNAAIPVVTVVLVVLLGLYFDGRASLGEPGSLTDILGAANAFHALLWGSLAGVLVAFLLATVQRILQIKEAIEAWAAGMRSMLLAIVILVLAWSLGAATVAVGTAEYVTHILESAGFPLRLLPVSVFAAAACIAFATGTSWATMAILIPLVIPLAVALGGGIGGDADYTLLLGTISSVLAGAIFGDHCSPISDTTVLSSMASAADHVDHVRTQLPYALVVAVVGMIVGDIPTAYGVPWFVSYAVGIAVLFLVLRFFGGVVDQGALRIDQT
ncbi:MAG: Na+/H+ antiporter NhaC family protein [Gemmatimonadota bacterium]|nr:MAG: Na+/H+ antiporter NhaC family protein [Gemmatimonadota bacterium]